VLIKTKRLKDVVWYDTDGGDSISFATENTLGTITKLPEDGWFRGMPNAASLSANSFSISGISRIRITDPIGWSGGQVGDWLWHGKQLRTLIVEYVTPGGSRVCKAINLPVGLEVVVPRGYYPLLVKDPRPLSSMNIKVVFRNYRKVMTAGEMSESGSSSWFNSFVSPCHPGWSLGDPAMDYHDYDPVKRGTNIMYFHLDYRYISQPIRFRFKNERFRFLAVDKRGVISENSDAFRIKKWHNFFGFGTDIPVLYRENIRS
jgi:hypothetical protein